MEIEESYSFSLRNYPGKTQTAQKRSQTVEGSRMSQYQQTKNKYVEQNTYLGSG